VKNRFQSLPFKCNLQRYNTDMTRHPQYVTVRNDKGKEMMDMIRNECDVTPSVSSGERKPFVMQTVISVGGRYKSNPDVCFSCLSSSVSMLCLIQLTHKLHSAW
jgi:hypothetical protein